ncbi:MAG: sigma-70 family RNA polymerase sigma factor [Clostridia bacterium]|nr:sigma-70 family RNA polymerase sigma factor [Clostridia bacterium]
MRKDEKYLMSEAQRGNCKALEELIKQNNGLIWSIVRRFYGRGYDLEDLYQIGSIGFIKSVKRFDMSYEYKMSTFAVPYIMGEIKKFIRDDGMIKISRTIKELSIKVKDIEQEYLKKNGESLSVKELARLLDESEENICLALEAGRQIESINAEIFENGKEEKVERVIGKNQDEQNKIIDRLTINDMIEKLGIRDKTIIRLRYFKQKTQTQVAKILGISQVQVSRIEKKILDDMKEKMVG